MAWFDISVTVVIIVEYGHNNLLYSFVWVTLHGYDK